jgi:hypothetical protein
VQDFRPEVHVCHNGSCHLFGYSCQLQRRASYGYWLAVDSDAPHSSLLPAIIDRYVCFSANTRLSAPKQKDVTTNSLGPTVSNTANCSLQCHEAPSTKVSNQMPKFAF